MRNRCPVTLISVKTMATILALSATNLCGCSAIPEQAFLGWMPHRSAKLHGTKVCRGGDPFLPAENDAQPELSQQPDTDRHWMAAKPLDHSTAPVAD